MGGLGVDARQDGAEEQGIHPRQITGRQRDGRCIAVLRAASATMVGAQLPIADLEVLERIERLVDAGEPQVGDLVEFAQRAEDRQADLVRVDLRRPGLPHGLFDLLREHGEIRLGHRAALARLAHARHDLLATERLDHARSA